MREHVRDASRVVIKLGTRVVAHDAGEFALGRVFQIVETIARLQRSGRRAIVVSSGAVGLGMRALGLQERPLSLGLRQACAAAGQGRLIALYTQAFEQLDIPVAQVLLTQEDLSDPDRALCVRTTLLRLVELGVVPIINENDSVSVRELVEYRRGARDEAALDQPVVFGDNDVLSAKIAVGLDADLLVLLTDVDGVHTANPKRDPAAQRIPTLDAEALARIAGEAEGTSTGGTGGMASKLSAARQASDAGVEVVIANGTDANAVELALAGADVGTWVCAEGPKNRRRRRIAQAASQGALIVNAGAARALAEKKASLLPVGVTTVEGEFKRGDVVEIRDGSGLVLGRGLVNYDAEACRKLAGRHSDTIGDVLGWRGYDAVVTRDNLAMGEL